MTSLAPASSASFAPGSSSTPTPQLQRQASEHRQAPIRRTTLTSPREGAAFPSQTPRHRSDEYDEEDEGEDEDDEEYYEGGQSGVQRSGGVMGGGEGREGNSMLNEVTVKSGYLWKKGEKRKVSLYRWK